MFSKKDWKYILLFGGAVLLMILSEVLTPKPIDWSRSYSKSDKKPYGNIILFEQLQQLFGEDNILINRVTAFEAQQAAAWDNYSSVFYLNETFEPSELETKMLLAWVDQGKQLFVAAREFSGVFADTLDLSTSYTVFKQPFKGESGTQTEKEEINFTNKNLKALSGYTYKSGTTNFYFNEFDSEITTVLGMDAKQHPNFIQIPYGDGMIYLHSNPLVFTNYNMLLENNHEYVSKALSYLPNEPLIWDEYYKSGREGSQSTMRFIFSQLALKWAWWLTLISMSVYVLFNIKRKQRIIPIFQPPSNTTLEFVETIGRLYYQNKDHKDLAQKKVLYFKDYIRIHFYMNIQHWSKQDIHHLAAKSGVEENQVQKLADLILSILNTAEKTSEEQLVKLNKEIDNFKKAVDLI